MPLDILSLDLGGAATGWARAPAGTKQPTSGSVELGKGAHGPGRLGVWLRDHKLEYGKPDLIFVEKWLPLDAQRNWRAAEMALRLNGAVHAMAGVYGIPVAEVSPDTIRATVCGHKNAGGREETKKMVIATMKLLGLMPRDAPADDNRADALCGWRYAESVYGRCPPADLVLTP